MEGRVSAIRRIVLFLWFLASGLAAAFSPHSFSVIFVAAALVLIGLDFADRRHGVVRLSFPFVLLLLFTAYGALSALWAPEPEAALKQAAQFLAVFLPAGLLMHALTRLNFDEARAAAHGLVIGVCLALLVFAVDVLSDGALYKAVQGSFYTLIRPEAPLDTSENVINRRAVPAALFVWPLAAWLWHRVTRGWALAVVLALTLVVLPSSSQAVAVAMPVGLAVLLLAMWRPKLAEPIAIAIPLLLLPAALPLAWALDVLGAADWSWLPYSAKVRAEAWPLIADLTAQRWFSGWGLEASRSLPAVMEMAEPTGRPALVEVPMHPHHFYLQIWFELGIVGAAILLVATLAAALPLRRLAAPLHACGLALLATFCSGVAVSFGGWQTWLLACFFTAVAGMVVMTRLLDARPPNGAEAARR